MLACDTREAWEQFLDFVKKRCSATAFGNWLAPIRVPDSSPDEISLEIPNIFVKEYLLSNYKKDLCAFLPVNAAGEPNIRFIIAPPEKKMPSKPIKSLPEASEKPDASRASSYEVSLNDNYRFETFIEGPANQFVKSAAMGVGMHPGQSYNPLFIHGGVGLGKTHLLHSIGHYIRARHKNLRVQCITMESFLNDFVDGLRNKSVDRIKKFYRSDIDVFLLDDMQFLENRLNFQDEVSNTFEILKNRQKQIVITSDKPPAQLKLSERMIARMEWGLVAHIGVPELETRVAILQHKAEQKGLHIPHNVAFFIAEHIHNNVRQLEGAVNRLSAHARLFDLKVTEEVVMDILKEAFRQLPNQKISVERILQSVATIFEVKIVDLKGSCRKKEMVVPRQVAMYLAKKMAGETLATLSAAFGKKTHSTILHASTSIEEKLAVDHILRSRIDMVIRNIGSA